MGCGLDNDLFTREGMLGALCSGSGQQPISERIFRGPIRRELTEDDRGCERLGATETTGNTRSRDSPANCARNKRRKR